VITPLEAAGRKPLYRNIAQRILTGPILAFRFIGRQLFNVESNPAAVGHNSIWVNVVGKVIVQMFLNYTTVRWLMVVRVNLE
jgi:hypothetical protein